MERDSIVFYKDWWEAISSLPEDKQPEAIRAVMDYAFKGIEPEDTMLRFATAQIRMFIDRDRTKYEKAVQQRRDAIRKRWEKAKANKKKEPNTTEYDRIQKNTEKCKSIRPNTTEYYNENENENGNENDNEQKEIDKSIPSAAINLSRTGATAAAASDFRVKIAELKSNAIWLEQMAMKFHTTSDEVCRQLEDFREDMELRGRHVSSPQGLFVTWLGGKMYGSKPGNASSEPGLGVGEFRNSRGQRTYGTSGVAVPESAPPRPSAAHWWSDTSRMWEKAI